MPHLCPRCNGVTDEQLNIPLEPPFSSHGQPRVPLSLQHTEGQPLAATSPLLPELCQLKRLCCIYYGRGTYTQ